MKDNKRNSDKSVKTRKMTRQEQEPLQEGKEEKDDKTIKGTATRVQRRDR